eukprot:1177220-Prorocentrum_minimum.AAC.1
MAASKTTSQSVLAEVLTSLGEAEGSLRTAADLHLEAWSEHLDPAAEDTAYLSEQTEQVREPIT